MCDAFLVLAQAPGGLTCFLAPRWRPDGTKNPIQVIRLKRKMGNVSNASSETEWRGALAWRVGPEGRGVATIIEMVATTRFDCMIGSSAGMRMAVGPGDRPLPPAQGVRRAADRPAGDAERARRSRPRSGGLARPDAAHRARARQSRRRARGRARRGSARRSANTGSASARPPTPTRRWNASAAPARWRIRRCRASIARRRSTRSGRAAATCSASTCCARSARRRRRSKRISPRSRASRGENRALDAHVDDAEGRHARSLRFRGARPRPLRPPRARPRGERDGQGRARRQRRCLLPLAAGGAAASTIMARCRAGSISRRSSSAPRRGEGAAVGWVALRRRRRGSHRRTASQSPSPCMARRRTGVLSNALCGGEVAARARRSSGDRVGRSDPGLQSADHAQRAPPERRAVGAPATGRRGCRDLTPRGSRRARPGCGSRRATSSSCCEDALSPCSRRCRARTR